MYTTEKKKVSNVTPKRKRIIPRSESVVWPSSSIPVVVPEHGRASRHHNAKAQPLYRLVKGHTFRSHIFPVVLLARRPPLGRVASPAPALRHRRREVTRAPDTPSARPRLGRGTGRLSGSSRESIRCYICRVSTGCKRLCHACRTHEACWRRAGPPAEKTSRGTLES